MLVETPDLMAVRPEKDLCQQVGKQVLIKVDENQQRGFVTERNGHHLRFLSLLSPSRMSQALTEHGQGLRRLVSGMLLPW